MKPSPEAGGIKSRIAEREEALLQRFFSPRNVAVIGAAREEDKVGHVIFDNLIKDFDGEVYPVNPKAAMIHSHHVFKSVTDISESVDLAVVAVPGKLVPRVMEECGQAGIRAVIIISAGFKETGIEGAKLEAETLAVARCWGIRFLGPNCLGVIDTASRLNASFAGDLPMAGHIAFMSQSGALCAAILDWAKGESVGFSKFVSLGNKADITEIDLLNAWRDDPFTKAISIYMEGVGDGRRFIDTAIRVSRQKPIIALKAGSTNAGARAVSSHTGTLAGSESVYRAALRQAGIVQAESVESLFDYALGFAYQPVPSGRRLAIITNAGGPGIMATDACERAGLQLAQFNSDTVARLRENLPLEANIYNPVDVLGDALADRYRLALEAVLADDGTDVVLVLLTPQAMTDISGTAGVLADINRKSDKPIFASFMGMAEVNTGVAILKKNQIPNFYFPERAVATIRAMVEWEEQSRRRPGKITAFSVDRRAVDQIFHRAKLRGRTWLPDTQASGVLAAYGVRIPKKKLAKNMREALAFAEEIGYPVAVKVASPDILHKSDIGGIKLNIQTEAELEEAFESIQNNVLRYLPEAVFWGVSVNEMITEAREVIIGVNRDPQFGPLIMFGLGGIYVEVLKDVSWRIAPVTREDAEEMIREIKSYLLLRGVRGQPRADIDAVVETIQRVSQLAIDFPQILEMDINPLMVLEAGKGCAAADVRLSLRG